MAEDRQAEEDHNRARIDDEEDWGTESQRPSNSGLAMEFEVSRVSLAKIYADLESFKAVLADIVDVGQGTEVGFDDLLSAIFARLQDYTSDELVGLSLYIVNMVLIHRQSLTDASTTDLFECLTQLIEQSIDSRNAASLFIAVEALGSRDLSRAVGSKPGHR